MHRAEGDTNFSDGRKHWYSVLTHEETNRYLTADSDVFLHQALSTPCLDVLAAADGIYITDLQGKKYMDFHGNNVHQLGHRHPFIIERIKQQMEVLPFSPRRYTNLPAIELAQKLGSLLPGDLKRVLFAPGGTSAVSMALKLARYVTGKHKVISYWDSFHGASLDAIAVGGEAEFRKGMGPISVGSERIPPPVSYRKLFSSADNDLDSADYLEYVIEKEGEVGAFIAETIRNTDVQIPSKKYWQRVREICSRHQVLLILDEIPIAFGRTGKMFAFEHYGIEPDILCLGKGLGGGIMPMAAIVAREEYNVAQEISLGHFTHEKNPLGSVAALAMFEVMAKEIILEKVVEDEKFMCEGLSALQSKHKIIGDIRGLGLLWGIELVKDRATKERATKEADQVLYKCLQRGLSFKVSQGNVLQLSPPLIIERYQLAEAIRILGEVLSEIII
jgi:4-aminobutyrate aminotransferase